MRMAMAGLACLALLGCATPDELKARDDKVKFSSRLGAADAAECVARATENYIPQLTVRVARSGAEYDVTVKNDIVLLALVEAKPAQAGSDLAVALPSYAWANRADWIDAIKQTCS